ncbi:thioredoxin family protein [Chryseomicrobium palamuruense]|uniref:Thioredoxin family protein n=1 Tax=Chryseomicrobium palamuruense TaxID=682973 RepID=A0ABV8UVA2_9BACL
MIETTYADWKQEQMKWLYIYTPMCGTCQVASKMLTVCEEVLQQPIPQLNANYAPELMHEEQIESVPCLLLRNDQGEYLKIYAFQSVPYLLEQMNET